MIIHEIFKKSRFIMTLRKLHTSISYTIRDKSSARDFLKIANISNTLFTRRDTK